MTELRGHRLVDHTADEIVEAWGPSRAACLEEAALGLVELFARPTSTTPTRSHEATLDGRDPATLLLEVLSEIIYLADAENAVPAAVGVFDQGEHVRVHLDLVTTGDVEATGPAPKGVSHSGLDLRNDGARWTARALIDL